ncbi:MAG TPA: efflux transporter outer membrane subunit [Burkholderiales bacterium]
MRSRRFYAAAVLLAATAGCTTVGPTFARPAVELPAVYHTPVPALFRDAAPVEHWWELLGDEQLNRLIARGLAANLGLRAAASRVLEARALARGAAARAGPRLDAGASGAVDATRDLEGDRDRTVRSADVFLEGFWEIDLFGRLARTREAAWAEAERQQALADEAARLTVAEIARTYVELRAAERRLQLTEQSLELQRQTLKLVRARVDAGLAPGLDQVRAQAAVATLEADLGPLRSEIGRLQNALAVLLGEPPGALAEMLAKRGSIPSVRTGAMIGVPADLVRRRPDVRAAELLVAVATAEVGIATAELYPRLTLPGVLSVGYTNSPVAAARRSLVASLSLLLDVPLYDGGERRANVTAAKERLVQSTLLYEERLLRALEEVEAALLGYTGARARRDALITAVENNRLAYEQSQHLYRQGLITFLDVLDSQREWNESLQELATAEQALALEFVNLYSALGGGARMAPVSDTRAGTAAYADEDR